MLYLMSNIGGNFQALPTPSSHVSSGSIDPKLVLTPHQPGILNHDHRSAPKLVSPYVSSFPLDLFWWATLLPFPQSTGISKQFMSFASSSGPIR